MKSEESDYATDELKFEAHKNTLGSLLNPFTRSDHKIMGFLFLVTIFTQLYLILSDFHYYLHHLGWFHLVPYAVAIGVNLSALRNFRFLSRKRENPGMFAENRTFSYAFLQENMWFQIMMFIFMMGGHPLIVQYVEPPVQVFLMLWIYSVRELAPKTSYVSWEKGNSKVNQDQKRKSDFWVRLINANVKLVRWNYVLKKTMAYYLMTTIQAEWFHRVPVGTYVDERTLRLYYLLTMDASWNITAAFFLQTLKFKGYISASFSFLFNFTPTLGFGVMVYLFIVHRFVWIVLLAAVVDVAVNLGFIYPSRTLSYNWKNRYQVLVKAAGVFFALVLPYILTAP